MAITNKQLSQRAPAHIADKGHMEAVLVSGGRELEYQLIEATDAECDGSIVIKIMAGQTGEVKTQVENFNVDVKRVEVGLPLLFIWQEDSEASDDSTVIDYEARTITTTFQPGYDEVDLLCKISGSYAGSLRVAPAFAGDAAQAKCTGNGKADYNFYSDLETRA